MCAMCAACVASNDARQCVYVCVCVCLDLMLGECNSIPKRHCPLSKGVSLKKNASVHLYKCVCAYLELKARPDQVRPGQGTSKEPRNVVQTCETVHTGCSD